MGSAHDKDDTARLREELGSATRAREALLAGIAHDLRNPLNTFAMSTGLLKDDLERNEVDVTRALNLVTRMERAAQRMQRLIDDLLEASRIEAKSVELAKRPESADLVVREALALVKPNAAEKGVAVEAGDVDPAVVLDVDRPRMIQALVSAVGFVLRTTADRGRVTVSATRDASDAVLTVRGVSPGELPASVPAPEEGRGGLALLIARGLVAAHGGQLAVNVSDGTQVVVRLPAAT
jgi:signal transduction histidine kinase